MKRLGVHILLFALLALSCISTDKKIFERGCAPQRHEGKDIVVAYEAPRASHYLLAEFTIQYGAGYEREEILRRLKNEAALCGADGILIGSFARSDNNWKWADKAANDSFDTSGYRLTVRAYRLE